MAARRTSQQEHKRRKLPTFLYIIEMNHKSDLLSRSKMPKTLYKISISIRTLHLSLHSYHFIDNANPSLKNCLLIYHGHFPDICHNTNIYPLLEICLHFARKFYSRWWQNVPRIPFEKLLCVKWEKRAPSFCVRELVSMYVCVCVCFCR